MFVIAVLNINESTASPYLYTTTSNNTIVDSLLKTTATITSKGMDERNERLVFDRIVRNCCGDATNPQYFLVTPKLLECLRSMDNDDVTVLIILNGPGIHSKWQPADVLKSLQTNATTSVNDENDENYQNISVLQKRKTLV